MGYKVPDWKNSEEDTTFDVTIGKKTYVIPKADYLTGKQVERMSRVDEIDGGMYAFLDELAPGLGTAFLDAPTKFFLEFLKEWHEKSGIDAGESSPSSSS